MTGGLAGVGRTTVHRFAQAKAKVGILARGNEALEAARAEVEKLGGEAIAIPTDVAYADQIEAAAEKIEQRFGPGE